MPAARKKRTPEDTAPETPEAQGQDTTPETPETTPDQGPNGDAPQKAADDPYAGLSDEGHNEFAAQLLDQAKELAGEKSRIMERIGKNRDALRLVKDTGLVSEKQAKAIELFYPWRGKTADTNGATQEQAQEKAQETAQQEAQEGPDTQEAPQEAPANA